MPEKIKLTDKQALEYIIPILEEKNHPYKNEETKALEDTGLIFTSSTSIEVHEMKDVGLTYQGKEIILKDGSALFLRWIQPGPHPNPLRREDSYFGGERSVEREAHLIGNVVGKRAELPTPKVIYAGHIKLSKILLTEMPKGIRAIEFFKNSLESFLTVVDFLGQDIAKAHSVKFDNFGPILPPGRAQDKIESFGQYLQNIMGRHLTDENIDILKKYFQGDNFDKLTKHINDVIDYAENELKDEVEPCLILYDQHPRNFKVDEKTGKPSAYYNLEYCQAAHPSIELGAIGFQIFGGVFPGHVKEARKAFMKGYKKAGGSDIINDEKLETIAAINHLVSAVKNYDADSKNEESVKKTWSQDFANLTLKIIADGEVKNDSYAEFTHIIKPITQQYTDK